MPSRPHLHSHKDHHPAGQRRRPLKKNLIIHACCEGMHLSLLLLLFLGLGLATATPPAYSEDVGKANPHRHSGGHEPSVPLGTRRAGSRPSPTPPALVTVRLWPRSQWDSQKRYKAARVVATRAVRVCTRANAEGECANERDAWTTAVARDPPYMDPVESSHRRHRLPAPHLSEIYRTYDNLTYAELRTGPGAPPLEKEDYALLEKAGMVAERSPGKLVMRWGVGHLWSVPMAHWNEGERSLHTGSGLRTEWLPVDPADLDDRPLYMPENAP